MADDLTQRSFRLSDRPARPKSSGGTDPLAELARLIGQTDPFGEYGREQARAAARAGEPANDWTASRTAKPSADWSTPPTATVDWNAPPRPVPGYPAPRLHGPGAAAALADDTFSAPGHDELDPVRADNDAHEQAAEHLSEDPDIARLEGEHADIYEHDEPPRRTAVIAIAAVFALAVIGTAGAFGYRALFGNSGTIPPPVIKADPTPIKVEAAKSSSKLVQDQAPTPPERLVSREEKPVELKNEPASAVAPGQVNPQARALPPGVISTEPKKVHTIAIRPDQAASAAPEAAPPAAPAVTRVPAPPPRPAVTHAPPQRTAVTDPRNGPLSLNPNAAPTPSAAHPAPPAPKQAVVAPPAAAAPVAPAIPGAAAGFAVQLSSQRSEAEAQAAFRSLQAKFPTQLGTQQALIRRVELREKGVYFRAMVGPFSSSDAAIKLCTSLKAAGGSCIVQKI
jgi:hypothetical protein